MPSEKDVTIPAAEGRQGQSLEAGQVLSGRYAITGFIGAGGMGAVYAAKHLRTGRALALKVLLPQFAVRNDLMRRFLAEARAAGTLNHPGIVEVVDLDRDGELNFIVMERLEGEELHARIKREGRLAPAFVARIGADIADAISCAHANTPKIIHRDLKPQNILLARKGRQQDIVKILDFGIAKLVEDEFIDSFTRSGEVYGTPLYMPPEQLRNSKDVDERADIYAIGVILFHAITGVTPFRGGSYPDLVIAISTETPAAVRSLRPEVPADLAAAIERAMARHRDDRFPSALELRNALLPFAGDAPPAAGPDVFAVTAQVEPTTAKQVGAVATPVASPVPSRRGRLGAIAAVAAVIIAGAGIALTRTTPPVAPTTVGAPQPSAPTAAPADAAVDISASAAEVTVTPLSTPPAVPGPKKQTPRKTKGADVDDLPPLRPR